MGPTATEVVEEINRSGVPVKVTEPLPVKPTEPVPTYPAQAPPGSPPATPQPVYMKGDPNSWWGMNPNAVRLFQGGAIGVIVLAFWLMLRDKLGSDSSYREAAASVQTATQNALIEAFKSAQVDRAEEARNLNQSLIKTQGDIQVEMRGLADLIKAQTRVLEKLADKIDGKKTGDDPNPPAEGERPSGRG
jgi:hypothetical protein